MGVQSATLRAVAVSVQRACAAMAPALEAAAGDTTRGPQALADGVTRAQGALGRARASARFLAARCPAHSRAVRTAQRAVTRCAEALELAGRPLAPVTTGTWALRVLDVDKAVRAADRAAQAILVADDPSAFRRTG